MEDKTPGHIKNDLNSYIYIYNTNLKINHY